MSDQALAQGATAAPENAAPQQAPEVAPAAGPPPAGRTGQPPRRPRKSSAEIAANWNPRTEDTPEARAELAATPDPAKPDAASSAAPEAPKAEPAPAPSSALERQLSRSLADLQRAQAESASMRRELAEAKKIVEALEAAKKDPIALLAMGGHSYDGLTRSILDGKIRPATPESLAQAETRTELEKLRSMVEASQKREEDARSHVIAQQETAHVKETIGQQAEKYPALSRLDWAPEQARKLYYAMAENEGAGDLGKVLASMNAAVQRDVRSMLTDERTAKAILGDKEIREVVVKALGLATETQAKPAPARDPGDSARRNSPSALPADLAADAGNRVHRRRQQTAQERKNRAIAALERHLSRSN